MGVKIMCTATSLSLPPPTDLNPPLPHLPLDFSPLLSLYLSSLSLFFQLFGPCALKGDAGSNLKIRVHCIGVSG